MGCFCFQRRKHLALCWNVFWVRPSIGQALTNDTLFKLIGATGIVNTESNAVVMAKIKFREVTVKMFFSAVLVSAALEH